MTGRPGQAVSRPAVAGLVLAVGCGAAQQPPEALLGQDLPDPGAIERGRFGGAAGRLIS